MLLERLGKELLYFDGGMGTLLQSKGLQPGELPEVWNLEHAEEIILFPSVLFKIFNRWLYLNFFISSKV